MKSLATYTLAAFCALAASALASSGAQAAVILDISPEGKLVGARNVDVGGTLYDVTFQLGSCIALFNGCDEASDFTFHDRATAVMAATALSETVFLDSALGAFDSVPTLTSECANAPYCQIMIPYAVVGGDLALISTFINYAQPDRDVVFSSGLPSDDTSFPRPYAFFVPSVSVPEPASALLLGAGLIGSIALGRRDRRGNSHPATA